MLNQWFPKQNSNVELLKKDYLFTIKEADRDDKLKKEITKKIKSQLIDLKNKNWLQK